MNFIKRFKNMFSHPVITIIVIILTIYTLYMNIGGQNIFDRLASLLPVLLVAIAIICLQLKKQSLASHLILLFTSFLQSGKTFIDTLFSFSTSAFSFSMPWTLELIIQAIIFMYLILYVLSFILDGQSKFRLDSSPVLTSVMVAFIFFFFRDGFSEAILKIVPAIIALMFGSELFAIVLLLAGVIDVPFNVLSKLIENTLFNQSLSYYVFAFFAIYLMIGAIKGIIKHIK